jgi:hypothetical protein
MPDGSQDWWVQAAWTVTGLFIGGYAFYTTFLRSNDEEREQRERRAKLAAQREGRMQNALQGYFAQEGDDTLAMYESEKVARKAQIAEDRAFRDQQDAEYESALQHDRESAVRKEREKHEAAEAVELEAAIKLSEQLAQQQAEKRAKEDFEEKQNSIPDEPAKGEPALMLSIRIQNGQRLNRKWAPSTTIGQLVSTECDCSPPPS